MSKIITDTMYTVRFTGDYFSMTTEVWATNENSAEALAAELLLQQYGWNVAEVSNDIEIEYEWSQ
tara:strand:- start:269 stop:463 length:195 start_codon:yes stop_codon:yes gene_type:complete